MMKTASTYFLFLLFLQNYLCAQNLIPNPGFEKHNGDCLYDWVQPSIPYYHFQYKYDSLLRPHSGNCVNGICMRHNNENEYLSVRLKEALKKDKKYYLKMYVKLSGGLGCPVNHIDWCFRGNDSLMNIPMGYFWLTPLVKFDFPKNSELEQWTLMEMTYIANGTEQFLTVGHFAPEVETQSLTLLKDNLKTENNLRLTDKGKKRGDKDDDEFRKKMNQIAVQQSRQLNSSRDRSQFFFDDFCISAIKDDGSYCCEDSITAICADTPTEIKNIFFEQGKSILLEESFPSLDNLFAILVKSPSMKIQINGHTDNKGTEVMNQHLSEKRAKSVVDYLILNGISPDRLSYVGFGSTMPVSANDTDDGRMQNRRVEFTVKK